MTAQNGIVQMTADAGAKKLKLGWGAALLIVAAGLGYITPDYGFMAGMGAFIFGVSGISVIAAAFSFSGRAPCPRCSNELHDLPADGDGAFCGTCSDYYLCESKTVRVMPENHVAKMSTYGITVEPGHVPALAPICAECGAPAAHWKPWPMSKTGASVPGVARAVKTWEVSIPYCASHTDGGVTSYEGRLSMKSYRLWKASRR